MVDKLNLWLANFFYYGLFLSTMVIFTCLLLRPGEGWLWNAFRANHIPAKDIIFITSLSLYFLGSTVLLLYWGVIKKMGVTLSEFTLGFVLWLIGFGIILVDVLVGFYNMLSVSSIFPTN